MSTVRDLVTGSLRLLGVAASSETIAASEAEDGLEALNEMLASWSIDGLSIYTKVREEFSLVAGTASYTMGTGGDFNTTRPVKIWYAAIEDQSASPAYETPLHLATFQEWSQITSKELESSVPTYLYASGSFPLETLNLYPEPSVADKLVIYSEKLIGPYASVSTEVSLPPGYWRALRYNLAVELAPEYGKPVPQEIYAIAMDSWASLKRRNSKPLFLSADEAVRGSKAGFNWLTGE